MARDFDYSILLDAAYEPENIRLILGAALNHGYVLSSDLGCPNNSPALLSLDEAVSFCMFQNSLVYAQKESFLSLRFSFFSENGLISIGAIALFETAGELLDYMSRMTKIVRPFKIKAITIAEEYFWGAEPDTPTYNEPLIFVSAIAWA